MKKTTHLFGRIKSNQNGIFSQKILLFLVLLTVSQLSWGQQPVGTGQFDGGFENASLYTTGALTQTTPDLTNWSYDSANISASSIGSADVRSGSKSIALVNGGTLSTGKYIMSPKLSPALVGGDGTNVGPSYVVQYYIKCATATATKGAIYVNTRGSGTGTQAAAVNGWQKVTYRYVGVANTAAASTWAGFGVNQAVAFTAYVDDFVVYQGSADDNTAPDAPTGPVASGLDVSWTAPGTGVDGGGYMVVRYATNPNADNDPNVNGIYAVGNTITNGTGSLVGTVVYVGTATSFTDAVAGSVSGSDYYKIYTVDKAFNYSTEITVTAGAGSTTTTWNGSAWSNGVPDNTVEAVINGAYSTSGNINVKKLTVNTGGSLTVNSGNNVTVQNEVINSGGTITVENNANLIQVNNTTNTGTITVKRNSNALSRLDYTMWSSPVAGQKLADFSPLTSQSPSRFYTYDAATNLYAAVASPTTTNFTTGTGYLIRMPNTAVVAPATETFAGVFTGVPNNGNVSLTGLTSNVYYAVGNPYPSTISAASFLSGNTTAGTLYFWRKSNNAANSSYATWTTLGGTVNSGDPNAITPNGTIQVGQGFIVKTGGAATALNFTNAMREAAPTSTQFLKIAKTDETSRIWLNLTGSGLFSQALIGYVDGATEGVDNGIDGKYINDSKVALTSNIDGEEYTIQGRSAFDTSDVVSLTFKTDKAGEYKIAIDHTDGLFAKGQNIYLLDSVAGTETNLTKEAYTFTAESGATNSRFSLKYESTSKVSSPVFNENTVTVYKNNGTLYVDSATSAIANIKVFNVQGKLIAELKGVNAITAAIKNLKANHQILLIQVTSEDKKVVTKKVVN